jgi:exodeoxyribonuclease V gamma subunit
MLDRQHGLDPALAGYDAPWRVRHPLQPFDPRYFDPRNAQRDSIDQSADGSRADPRLYSYSQGFAELRADEAAQAWRFLAGCLPLVAGDAAANIELGTVIRFFRDPSRFVCKTALKLSRDALDDDAPDDREPLEMAVDKRDQLPLALIRDALAAGLAELPPLAPAHIAHSGRYASGELGARAWAQLVEETQPYLDAARTLAPFAAGATQAQSLAIDLPVADARLLGSVGPLYRCGDALWLVSISTSNVSFKQLLPLFLQWAALRLSLPDRQCRVAMVHKDGRNGPTIGLPLEFTEDPARLLQGLRRLIDMYRHAEQTAGVYYARTSYAFADAEADTRSTRPRSPRGDACRAWQGNAGAGFAGERDHRPLYNLMLAADESFLDSVEFADTARQLLQAITGRLPDAEAA